MYSAINLAIAACICLIGVAPSQGHYYEMMGGAPPPDYLQYYVPDNDPYRHTCSSHQCLSGKRLSIGGVILEEKIATSYCDETTNCTCVSFDVEFPIQNGVSAVSQYRMCMNSSMQDCLSLAKLHGLDERAKCTMSQCNTSNCNSFSQLETCPKLDPDDFQLSPKCSMKESWPILRCLTPLAVGYPYTSLSTCMSNIDQVYSCIRNFTDHCLAGNCLDIFTSIGLRQYYKMIVSNQHTNVTSLLKAFGLTEANIQQILGYACHVKGSPEEREIKNAIEICAYSDQMFYGMGTYFPACDARFVYDITNVAINLVKKYFTLTSQQEICEFVEDSMEYAMHAWDARCSKKTLAGFLRSILDRYDPGLAGAVMKGVDFLEKNWNTIPAVLCGKKEGKLPPVMKSKICFSGTITADEIRIYGGHSAEYCPINGQCGVAYEESNLQSTTTHRGCVSSGRMIDVCPIPVTNTKGNRNNLVNCTSTTCSREMCNQPLSHYDCPLLKPDEVQITPMCTLESKLDAVLSCVKPLLQAYPFSDLNTCKAKMAEPFNCVRNIALDCYSRVDCWDVFSSSDSTYDVYRDLVSAFKISSNVTALEEYYNRGPEAYYVALTWTESLCLVVDSHMARKAIKMLDQAPSSFTFFPSDYGIELCDKDMLNDVYTWSLQAAKQFFKARTQKQVCTLFNGIMDKISTAYQSRCGTKETAVFFSGLLKYITRSFPDVYKTVIVAEKLIAGFRLQCA